MKFRYAILPALAALAGSAAAAGPVPTMVKNIRPDPEVSEPLNLTAMPDGTLFFSANDGVNGRGLWKSDGTAAGTVPVPGTPYNLGVWVVPYAGGGAMQTADKVWRSDGTVPGTVQLHYTSDSYPSFLTPAGNKLFFTDLSHTRDPEIWCSTGGQAAMLKIIPVGSGRIDGCVAMGGALYFPAYDGQRWALWRSDGTAAGTAVVKEFPGGWIGEFYPWNGTLYFSARESTATGYELWKTDGTAAGTVMLRDIIPGSVDSNPVNFTTAHEELFFRVRIQGIGEQLWKTNGTSAGTVLVKNVVTPMGQFAGTPERLFFVVEKYPNAGSLWTSDGTDAGTFKLMDSTVEPGWLTIAGRRVYFAAAAGGPSQICVSDGTVAGTNMVGPGAFAMPIYLTTAGSRLFFTPVSVSGGSGSYELWSVPVMTAPRGSLALRAPGVNQVTFDATVDPGVQASTAVIQYGPTTAYGQSVSLTLSANYETETVAVPVDGLPAAAAGHARLVVTNADGTFTGPDVSFTTLPQAYAAWLQTHFGVSEVTDTSAPDADADGDANSNFLEFLAGTGPLSSTSHFATSFTAGATGVQMGPVRAGVRYIAETSANLSAWTAWPPVEFNAPAAVATIPLPAGGTQRFVRIKLELIP